MRKINKFIDEIPDSTFLRKPNERYNPPHPVHHFNHREGREWWQTNQSFLDILFEQYIENRYFRSIVFYYPLFVRGSLADFRLTEDSFFELIFWSKQLSTFDKPISLHNILEEHGNYIGHEKQRTHIVGGIINLFDFSFVQNLSSLTLTKFSKRGTGNRTIICNNTKLRVLKVSDGLHTLNCSNNEIERLDLVDAEIDYLDCSNNLVKIIDLEDVKSVQEFNCSNNLIEKLNIPRLLGLINLNCSKNNLTELDFSNLKEVTIGTGYILKSDLKSLDCSGNKLQKLDVRMLNNLEILVCDKNVKVIKHADQEVVIYAK